MKLLDGVIGTADISADEVYRYTLERSWGTRTARVLWIMLNPSTAGATIDDPTLRRCQHFTRCWGYDRLIIANLFALRSSDPKTLRLHADPVGCDNATHLEMLLQDPASELVVAAWGAHGGLRYRDASLIAVAARCGRDLYALGLTKDGKPKHPLARGRERVPDDAQPVIFRESTPGIVR